MTKKVVKICCSEWKNESRDKRELSVYHELGADVIVMAKGDPTDYYQKDCTEGFMVFRFSTRPLGKIVPKNINRAVSIFLWAHYLQAFSPDVISGHDIQGVLIGYLSNFRKKKDHRAKLIYDSHEFETGRATERSRLIIWLVKQLEKFLIRRCAFSIVVNDTIANELQSMYKLDIRPVVVRNTPNFWELDVQEIMRVRTKVCETMRIPEDTFIIMYHGGLMPQRNIETLIDAISRNPNIVGLVLGNAVSENYMEQLKCYTKTRYVDNRVLFHPAVPIGDLYKYVGAVNVGTILVSPTYKSYYYSLPNKFFENIQAMTPLITSDFPEMDRFIQQYGIGITVDVNNKYAIDDAIEKMRTNNEFYCKCKHNLINAKEELCWEKEKIVLARAYKGYVLKNDQN